MISSPGALFTNPRVGFIPKILEWLILTLSLSIIIISTIISSSSLLSLLVRPIISPLHQQTQGAIIYHEPTLPPSTTE